MFKGKQFFHCDDDGGVYVAINKVLLAHDNGSESSADDPLPSHALASQMARQTSRTSSPMSGESTEAYSVGRTATLGAADPAIDLPQPPLDIGERVVWISDAGPELGSVKWIGILPDCRIKEYTIGVEFVSASLLDFVRTCCLYFLQLLKSSTKICRFGCLPCNSVSCSQEIFDFGY